MVSCGQGTQNLVGVTEKFELSSELGQISTQFITSIQDKKPSVGVIENLE